jgi:hypothetical protein
MRKIVLALLLATIAAGLVCIPAAQAGEANAAHLYLVEKNPADWTPVPGGAWGKMRYRPAAPTFDFVFNGHKLVARESYTLLYYPDPWPGSGLICLGMAMADDWGNVHIKGQIATGNLPAVDDENYLKDPPGAKIWLVSSADVDCKVEHIMIGWNPTEYLFEGNLISYTEQAKKQAKK